MHCEFTLSVIRMAHFVADDFVVSMGMDTPCRSFRSLVVLSEYECIPESAMALRAVLQTWSVFKLAHKELLSDRFPKLQQNVYNLR